MFIKLPFNTLGLYVGKPYQGGIIGWIDGTGLHGLIIPYTNTGIYTLGSAPWGCPGTAISTSDTFGSGATNTANIVAACATPGIAARLCSDLVWAGYSDWFLPAINEIEDVYRGASKIKGFDATATYWSSYDAGNLTTAINCSGVGSIQAVSKNNSYAVLPCRYF